MPNATQMRTGKSCVKCGEYKDFSAFYRSKKYKSGYYGRCIDCSKIVSNSKDNREARLIRELRDYGLTVAQYLEMVEKQNGVCAICFEPEKKFSRLCVDHCHITGKVRGLLCGPCNSALGRFNDDPTRLLSAVRYLNG